MRLDNKEFKRFTELQAKAKAKKISSAEQQELDALTAKRNDKGSNAIEWWKAYPTLLKDVVNIPFNYIPGATFPLTISGTQANLYLGSVVLANVVPTIGKSASDTDAFNTQIRQLWLDLHRKYRGIGTYEKSDLGIALLAINEVFKTIAKFERIYGVINNYHIGNRVVPYGLKCALGISNDLEQNLADFRYRLNLAIQKVRQLCLPKGLSALEADLVMLSNMFKDSANRRACIFGFDTKSFGRYEPTLGFSAGAVLYEEYSNYTSASTPAGTDAFMLNDVQTILDKQIEAVLNDEDIARICSDLLAAYGPDNVMTLSDLPEDYKVEPVQDYERSVQFHNLTIMGPVGACYEAGISGDTTTDQTWLTSNGLTIPNQYVIYQKDNVIKCNMYISGSGSYYLNAGTNIYYPIASSTPQVRPMYGDLIFDTWVDEPGEVEVMCGTRFTSVAGGLAVGNNSVVQIAAYGTNIVTDVRVFYYTGVPNNEYSFDVIEGQVVTSTTNFNFLAGATERLRNMDWAPIFYDYRGSSMNIVGDVDNFARLNTINLDRLHEVAILSGFKFNCVSSGDK